MNTFMYEREKGTLIQANRRDDKKQEIFTRRLSQLLTLVSSSLSVIKQASGFSFLFTHAASE